MTDNNTISVQLSNLYIECEKRILASTTTERTTIIVTIIFIISLINFHTQKKKQQLLSKNNDIIFSNNYDDNNSDGIDIAFTNIKLVLKSKKSSVDDTIILNGSINGYVSSGEMVAILGPSGAGKSSLLHAIAGKIKYKKNLVLTGNRYIMNNTNTNNTNTNTNTNTNISLTADSLLPSCILIEQDVLFFPHMTVFETILFRLQLQCGIYYKNSTANTIVVNRILSKLDLVRVAHTIVGDTGKIRGISGGERKRLSIAVELVSSSPSIILLDEPTSGLDSTSALQLVRILRLLATNNSENNNGNGDNSDNNNTNYNKKTTIIAVLHQPNQHVLDSFNKILLLGQNGQQMFFGQRTNVREYFINTAKCIVSSCEIGTAEHCLDCISYYPMNDDEILNPTLVHDRINRLIQLSIIQCKEIVSKIVFSDNIVSQRFINSTSSSNKQSTSIFIQFTLLFSRSIKEIIRSKLTIVLYMVRLITMALIYGSIYQLTLSQTSINDRFGLLSLLIIGGANMGMSKTIRTFPKEKTIISYELASGMYSTVPYFISKALSEIPLTSVFNSIFGIVVYATTGLDPTYTKLCNFILLLIIHGIVSESVGLFIGSISPNSDIALAIYPAIVVLNIIFDGKNISEQNIPRVLRWIPKIGLVRWGFEGLCINEFNGLLFDISNSTVIPKNGNPFSSASARMATAATIRSTEIHTGTEALERFGLLSNRTIIDVIQAQITIALVCWFLSFLGLTLTRQRFVQMQKP